MVAKALRHFFNISIGMPFVHKMYGRIGLCEPSMIIKCFIMNLFITKANLKTYKIKLMAFIQVNKKYCDIEKQSIAVDIHFHFNSQGVSPSIKALKKTIS